jgi:hypothetical protein
MHPNYRDRHRPSWHRMLTGLPRRIGPPTLHLTGTYTMYCIEHGIGVLLSCALNFETHIQRLCVRALEEQDPEELGHILGELRDALHKHIESVRTSVAERYPLHLAREVG